MKRILEIIHVRVPIQRLHKQKNSSLFERIKKTFFDMLEKTRNFLLGQKSENFYILSTFLGPNSHF